MSSMDATMTLTGDLKHGVWGWRECANDPKGGVCTDPIHVAGCLLNISSGLEAQLIVNFIGSSSRHHGRRLFLQLILKRSCHIYIKQETPHYPAVIYQEAIYAHGVSLLVSQRHLDLQHVFATELFHHRCSTLMARCELLPESARWG